jgi:hypothetical protein
MGWKAVRFRVSTERTIAWPRDMPIMVFSAKWKNTFSLYRKVQRNNIKKVPVTTTAESMILDIIQDAPPFLVQIMFLYFCESNTRCFQ